MAQARRTAEEVRDLTQELHALLEVAVLDGRGLLDGAARREELEALAAGLPPAWRPAARVLFAAWDAAVRASSAAETWHSLLRPHLAVHRTLSPGWLALLAGWHNHRVFPRGVHAGASPLHLSGLAEAPTDWLDALGYPPGAVTAAALPASALDREVLAA